MGICSSWACCGFLLYLALFQTPFPIVLVTALQPRGFLTANSSTSWTNSPFPNYVKFKDGSFVRIILSSQPSNTSQLFAWASGLLCNQTGNNSTLFAIFSLNNDENDILTSSTPNVVWSANPKNPVSYNATLHLTSDKGLVLQDVDGTIAWSTNISSNKYVAGLRLTDTCNLQLLDENNATIWQSFDHPTDTLVIGPKFGARAATY